MKLLSRRSLRLGVHRLPEIEQVVIRTTVRLAAHQGSCKWKLVQIPPYDALLVDESDFDSLDEALRTTRFILKLTRDASDLPNSLQRPIRAEKLLLLLRSLPHTSREAWTHRLGVGERPKLAGTERFTLKRWPANKLLANDPERVLLASLLMRYTLSAAELADLSKQSVSRCTDFLHLLQQAGALELHSSSNDGSRLPPALDATAIHTPRVGMVGRLLNKIRRR